MFTEDSLDDILEKHTSEADVRRISHERRFFENQVKDNFISTKNHPKPQTELDLHGFTSQEAKPMAESFLKNALHQRLRTVSIVTGKGLHSKNQQSVLQGVVETLLIDLRRQNKVLGYKWGQGGGKVSVYLP